ncbi:MAG TPA: hypothetical protein VIX89_05115 [Bryobacteraceae bacterium]
MILSGFSAAGLFFLAAVPGGSADETEFPPDVFIAHLPQDLLNEQRGGAAKATIEDMAVYAWQEFVALHWPAKKGERDEPDESLQLGAAASPRVWETFRGRVEVYPGIGRPFDDPKPKKDYGYDGPARYIYDPESVGTYAGLQPGEVPACPGMQPSASVPLHNLDEPNHNNVHSGLSPKEPFPGQQILLESKANRQEYVYVASRGWYGEKSIRLPRKRTGDYVRSHLDAPPPAEMDDPDDTQYISFPVDTAELKAAWRRLGPRDDPKQFFIARVRYYKSVNGKPCYMDSSLTDPKDRWGLVAMHIMHKVPSAPYFTWATFEHVDSLVLPKLGPDGKPVKVENPDGSLTDAGKKIANPYTPNIQILPATVEREQVFVKESMTPPVQPESQLYYYQEAVADIPEVKYISINRRINEIPQPIVEINAGAQATMRKMAPNLALQYYKLVSMQWTPIDKKPGVYYEGKQSGLYYASNVIIEGPRVTQRFSGQFTTAFSKAGDYLNNEVPLFNPKPNPGDPVFFNVFLKGKGYLGGGCMGCHGFRQAYGTDWSFLLDRQRVAEPEIKPE